MSTIRDELLKEFLPDEVCPLGRQSFIGVPAGKVYGFDSKDSKSRSIEPPLLCPEDAFSFESQAKPNTVEQSGSCDILSIDQLLESVRIFAKSDQCGGCLDRLFH